MLECEGNAAYRRIVFRRRCPQGLPRQAEIPLSKCEGFPLALIDQVKSAGRGTQQLDIPPAQDSHI